MARKVLNGLLVVGNLQMGTDTGVLSFGTAGDVTLSRPTANQLKLDDALWVAGGDLDVTDGNVNVEGFVTATFLGDFSAAGIATKHEAGATPTGGSSGEVRVGTNKVWFQDAGTWRAVTPASVAVATPATSFATIVKFGTD